MRSVVLSGSEPGFQHPRAYDPYWSCQGEGFFNVNTDGTISSARNCASIGGLIRDEMGS